MTKMSNKKLKDLIKDEKMAVEEYKKYNFPSLAKDEAKHKRILMREQRRRLKKKCKCGDYE